MRRATWLILLLFTGVAGAKDYLVAVMERAAAAPGWSEVADALVAKHDAERVSWSGGPEKLLPVLRERKPRWLAVVGRPEDFDAAFVRGINRISRKLDDDPWGDVRWGLITGPTAADAKKLVEVSDPLVIKRALTTTGINLGLVDCGLTISDGAKGNWTEKKPDGTTEKGQWDEEKEPGGTVRRFADAWNKGKPQLLVTSSHATQFNLEMPWGLGLIASYGGHFHVLDMERRPEFARFLGGAMFTGDPGKLGKWIEGLGAPTLDADPETSKVWVAAGNCLIGDARGTTDSMLVTALGSGGVRQFVGYVVPTWFGRGGWGTLGLWQGHRGELSLADAFHLNQQKMVEETLRRFPKAMEVVFDSEDIQHGMRKGTDFAKGLQKLEKDGVKMEKDLLGLVHDRDVVALWGDPKWVATFAPDKRRPVSVSFEEQESGALRMVVWAKEKFSGEVASYLPRVLPGVRAAMAGGAELPEEFTVADDFVLLRGIELEAGGDFELVLRPGN